MCVVYKNVVETCIYINRGNWQQNEIHVQMIMIVTIIMIYCDKLIKTDEQQNGIHVRTIMIVMIVIICCGWSTEKVVIVKQKVC